MSVDSVSPLNKSFENRSLKKLQALFFFIFFVQTELTSEVKFTSEICLEKMYAALLGDVGAKVVHKMSLEYAFVALKIKIRHLFIIFLRDQEDFIKKLRNIPSQSPFSAVIG